MKADLRTTEREALEWATNFFRQNAENLRPGNETTTSADFITRWLLALHYGATPDGLPGQRIVIDAPAEQREASILEVCNGAAAERDQTVIRGLCKFAGILLLGGEQLTDPMRRFVADFLGNPERYKSSRAGRSAAGHFYRNSLIRLAVDHISQNWAFPPTRHERDRDRRDSATSIVKESLEKGAGVHLSEADIIKSYRKFS